MRVAIIAVEHRLIEHGQLFALSLVNGHPFLLRQIDALIAGGAEKLILIAAQRPRPILDLCHELSGRQIDIEIVHLLRDVRVDQRWTRVLFLTDQLILSPHAVEEAFIEDQGFLWASEDNSLNADLEHIDLHRRWLGIMSLSLSYFDGLSQMEEHWSPASYLLRHVLQQKVGQRILTDGELQQKRIQIIHDEAAIKQYAHQRRIDYWQAGAYSITFYMVSFLLKAVIEPVWERKNTISLSLGGGAFLFF